MEAHAQLAFSPPANDNQGVERVAAILDRAIDEANAFRSDERSFLGLTMFARPHYRAEEGPTKFSPNDYGETESTGQYIPFIIYVKDQAVLQYSLWHDRPDVLECIPLGPECEEIMPSINYRFVEAGFLVEGSRSGQ